MVSCGAGCIEVELGPGRILPDVLAMKLPNALLRLVNLGFGVLSGRTRPVENQ